MSDGRGESVRGAWWSLGMPLGLSLAVHALVLALVAGVAWQLAAPPAPDGPPPEAFIAVATPMSAVATPPARGEPPPARVVEPSVERAQPPAPEAGRVTIRQDAEPEPAERPAPATMSVAVDAPVGATISFAGLSAKRATSVVFVIDGSAPMVGVLPRVLAQVLASAGELLPVQQFGVVVFREEANGGHGAVETLSPRLLDATGRNLGKLADWLKRVEPKGRSNPLSGLRAALELRPRPQVVFLLSRSIPRSLGGEWGSGKEAILAELDALNPLDQRTQRRPTVIKALQFLEPDPTGTMQAIAERHGGGGTTPDYRVLTLKELPE